MNLYKSNKILVLILILLSVCVSHKISYCESKEFSVISRISVYVDNEPAGENIKDLIALEEGSPFSYKKVSNCIKQVYKTGLFSDVQVLKEGDKDIHLTFLLKSRYYVRELSFESNIDIPKKELEKLLFFLRQGSSYSEEKIRRAVLELKEFLHRQGYFQTDIETFSEKNHENSSVSIDFQIKSPGRFRITNIDFRGDLVVSDSKLRKLLSLREGKTFIPSILEEDLTKLEDFYHSMNYYRVEIEVGKDIDKNKKTIALVLNINLGEKIKIVIKGGNVPESLLEPIWKERIFEEWGLSEGEAKIVDYMRKKRYLFASVNSYIKKEDSEILVVYEVEPGQKYRIKEVSFKGNKEFSSPELKKELEIRREIPFSSLVEGDQIFELPQRIKDLYSMLGFPDTEVELRLDKNGKKVKAIYLIHEGKQEIIKSVSIEGISIFDPERIHEKITSFSGGPFFQPDIQKDIESIESFYLNQGVRGTEVKAKIEPLDSNLYKVDFMVNEGNKVKIEEIVVTGNVITKKEIIIRELRIEEGDYAFYDSILESKRRLERLGIFTSVKIEEIKLSPKKENLVVNVREGDRNYASLGIGLETENEPKSFAVWNNTIRPRGTAEVIRNNIFGTGSQISVVGQLSIKEKRAVVSWEQPYLFQLPVQTYLNAWLEREGRKSYSFYRRGVSLTAIRNVTKEQMILLTLRFARTTLFDLQFSESEVDRQHFPFSTTSISGSYIMDKRDDPFNPQEGFFLSTVLEWAYPLFNAESDYLKTFAKYQQFIPLFNQVSLSSTARLGLGRGRMPIHERFFAGGGHSFRGQEFDDLGPKDPDSSNPVGGKALVLFNLELTFPVFPAVKDLCGALFYDTGNVFSKRSLFSLSSFQHALGFGLRYKTPLGPLRVECAWNLSVPKEEKRFFTFITIGHIF